MAWTRTRCSAARNGKGPLPVVPDHPISIFARMQTQRRQLNFSRSFPFLTNSVCQLDRLGLSYGLFISSSAGELDTISIAKSDKHASSKRDRFMASGATVCRDLCVVAIDRGLDCRLVGVRAVRSNSPGRLSRPCRPCTRIVAETRHSRRRRGAESRPEHPNKSHRHSGLSNLRYASFHAPACTPDPGHYCCSGPLGPRPCR